MPPPCVSLRLGSTVADAGLTGGTDIGTFQYQVNSWNDLWGTIPLRGQHVAVSGRAGRMLLGSKLPDWRLLTLNITSMLEQPTGGIDPAFSELCEQQDRNLLDLLGHFGTDDGLIIEWVTGLGFSLWVQAFTLQRGTVAAPNEYRFLSQPLEASYPFWRYDVLDSEAISGADTITNGGTAPIMDAVLVFSGDGSFTNSTTGQTLTVSGSSGAVTVDTLNKTVLEGGTDADGVLAADSAEWMRFEEGVNNVTSTVSVTVRKRDAYV